MSTRISYVPAHRLPILYRSALSSMTMRSLQARARMFDVSFVAPLLCIRSRASERGGAGRKRYVRECAMRCAAALVVAVRQHVQDSATASAGVMKPKISSTASVGDGALCSSNSRRSDPWNFTQIRNAFLRPCNGSSVLSGRRPQVDGQA